MSAMVVRPGVHGLSFVLEGRQGCVALGLLIQCTRFDPVGCDPECVSSCCHGLDSTGSNGLPVLLDLHLPTDQIIPIFTMAQLQYLSYCELLMLMHTKRYTPTSICSVLVPPLKASR